MGSGSVGGTWSFLMGMVLVLKGWWVEDEVSGATCVVEAGKGCL